jgi:hypothetical protein
MTPEEEKKAKKSEYMKNYYANLSRFQKEKRRLRNLQTKYNNYHSLNEDGTPSGKEKTQNYYYKNIEKIKAYQAEYRKKQKQKKES